MTDQPEHPVPTFSPRFIGWAVAAGAVAAIAAVGIAVGEPSPPYRSLLAATIVSGVVTSGIVVLTDLVLHVAAIFDRKYEAAEQAAADYQKAMTEILDGISANQTQIIDMITKLDNQINRCIGEIGIVSEGLSDLREAFVEEGLPENRDRLGHERRGPGSRAAHCHTISTLASVFSSV